MVRSSYIKNNYGHVISSLVRLYRPKKIVEFGILDGFSLEAILGAADPGAEIEAYDIFDNFKYNRADYNVMRDKFGDIVKYGDFWDKHLRIAENSCNMIHVDIANDGSVYEFALSNYMSKLTPGGVMLLEGGSEERDNVSWMLEGNRKKIVSVMRDCTYSHFTFEPFPSLTIIYKEQR